MTQMNKLAAAILATTILASTVLPRRANAHDSAEAEGNRAAVAAGLQA